LRRVFGASDAQKPDANVNACQNRPHVR